MEDNTYFKSKQKRIVNAIENAAKIMPKDAPVRDENLHKNEKEVISDGFGMNLKGEPYEKMTDDEKQKFINKSDTGVEYKQFQDMMEKTDTDIATDEELPGFNDDKNDLFENKVQEKYNKFVGELSLGKYPYSAKDSKNKKKNTKFKKLRQKVAGDIYDNELKRTDIAAKRNGFRGRTFYGAGFKDNEYKGPLNAYDMRVIREFLDGKYHLDGLQYKEFCRFSLLWKLFKFIVREKWFYFISNIYTKLVIKLPNKRYYGYKDLDDMMESTGGKPYTSLLTNNNINPDSMYYSSDKDGNIVDLKPEYEALLKKKYASLTGFKDKKDASQEEMEKAIIEAVKKDAVDYQQKIQNIVHEPEHGDETGKK